MHEMCEKIIVEIYSKSKTNIKFFQVCYNKFRKLKFKFF